MAIRTPDIVPKATRMFTDREIPRASFDKAYNTVKKELGGTSEIHVLSYYGIGGIGKTRLLRELESELKKANSSARSIYIDFSINHDMISVLKMMKNTLSDSCKFDFSLFDTALFLYSKRVGTSADPIESKQVIDSSPTLSLLFQAAKALPLVGTAAKILEIATTVIPLADKALSIFNTKMKMHNKFVRSLDSMDTNTLYKHLPVAFAHDMTYNLKNNNEEPVVIFLDTYEMLASNIGAPGIPSLADEWIRGELGLVQNIPHTLWVIATRDMLKWEEFNPELNEFVEQHALKELSSNDSKKFLKSTGIDDEKLINELITLTKGTPVYLDACVDTFLRISKTGQTPEISMFGENQTELIERFVRYMTHTEKDLAYMLSCISEWDDSFIEELACSIMPNFSFSAYDDVTDFSFVTTYDDGSYCVDRTFGDILKKNCPEILKRRTGNVLLEHFSKILSQKNPIDPEFSRALTYVTRAGMLLHDGDRDKLSEFFAENVYGNVMLLAEAEMFESADRIFNMLSVYMAENKKDVFYASLLYWDARKAHIKSNYKEAFNKLSESLELHKSLLGETKPETLKTIEFLAVIYSELGNHDEAVRLSEFVLKYRRKLIGEDDLLTVTSLGNLGAFLYSSGKPREALDKFKQLYEKRSKILGENHPDTISAMKNTANAFYVLNEYQQSLEWLQKAFEKARENLGENHPETLSIMDSLAFTLNELACGPEKALELRQILLKKRLRLRSEEHPETLSSMHNVANSLSSLGKYEDAAELYRTAFEKRRKVLGKRHPKTLSSMEGLAFTLRKLNRYQEAKEMSRSSYELHCKVFGELDLKTLDSMNRFASVLNEAKEYEKAKEIYQSLYERRCKILGESDIVTIDTLDFLANILHNNLSKPEEALPMFETVFEKRRELFGENSSEALTAMSNLAICYDSVNEHEKAEALREKMKMLTEN